VRRSISLIVTVLACLAMAVAAGTPARAAGPRPVVFVHGYAGSAANWTTAESDFRAAGYGSNQLFAYEYDSFGDNRVAAAGLRTFVDEVKSRTGASQVDIVNQLKALGDKVKVQTGDQFSFEHLDYNFKTEFSDLKVRQAFAKCVPRDQIVNNLLKPQNPNGTIAQSRFIFPFQPEYTDYVSGLGAEQYDKADIAGAKKLLADAGKTGMEVKIGWQKVPEAPNKRRVDTIALIKASCDQAGFKIVDGGTPTFFAKDLSAGSWDIALFAWIGSPLVSGDPSIYQTKKGGKGGQNNGQYSNPKVDALLDSVTRELDKAKVLEIRKQVDQLLWDDLATIPLFPFPGLVATDAATSNVQINATNNDITWNAFDWTRTAS